MGLVLDAGNVEVTEALEEYAAARVKRLGTLFCAEPEVSIALSADGDAPVVTELIVSIRDYRTLKATGKAGDARSSIDRAAKKLEWKYRLFWARGSFRFGDCC